METPSLTININPCELSALEQEGFSLCISRKVRNDHTVVWKAIENIRATNVIQFSRQYQIFGQTTYNGGSPVSSTTNSVQVSGGQTVVIDNCGVFGYATGGVDNSSSIKCVNEFDLMYFGISEYDQESESFLPLYLNKTTTCYGLTTAFSPEQYVKVWLEKNTKTSTIISDCASSYEVDLTCGSKTITFLGNNIWYEGPKLSFYMNGDTLQVEPICAFESSTIKHMVDFKVPITYSYYPLTHKLSSLLKDCGYTYISFDIDYNFSKLLISMKKKFSYEEVKDRCISDKIDVVNNIKQIMSIVKKEDKVDKIGNCDTLRSTVDITIPKPQTYRTIPVRSKLLFRTKRLLETWRWFEKGVPLQQ